MTLCCSPFVCSRLPISSSYALSLLLTDKEYYVRGCTALLDAVGHAINKIDNVQKHLPEEHRAGKVLFVITTDGLENSSTEFNYNDIKRMIEAKKECGWEFLFLGANIDAGKEAEKIGRVSGTPAGRDAVDKAKGKDQIL